MISENESLNNLSSQPLNLLTPIESNKEVIKAQNETNTKIQSPLKQIYEGSLLNENVHFTEEERKILKIQMEQVKD